MLIVVGIWLMGYISTNCFYWLKLRNTCIRSPVRLVGVAAASLQSGALAPFWLNLLGNLVLESTSIALEIGTHTLKCDFND